MRCCRTRLILYLPITACKTILTTCAGESAVLNKRPSVRYKEQTKKRFSATPSPLPFLLFASGSCVMYGLGSDSGSFSRKGCLSRVMPDSAAYEKDNGPANGPRGFPLRSFLSWNVYESLKNTLQDIFCQESSVPPFELVNLRLCGIVWSLKLKTGRIQGRHELGSDRAGRCSEQYNVGNVTIIAILREGIGPQC